jgi:hypothetical protein
MVKNLATAAIASLNKKINDETFPQPLAPLPKVTSKLSAR